VSLDYGFGDDFEREEADRADTDSELAHATLHGSDSPYTFSEGAGGDGVVPVTPRASTTHLPVAKASGASLANLTKPSSQTPGASASGARGGNRKEAA
jgi:hypothetical protein